jgi:putative ABC transport system substrate-binding protein
MRRREFITLLGGAAAAWPMAAQAQQSDRVRRIGVVIPYPESDTQIQAQVGAFREEIERLGWSNGRNVRIDYRWTGGEVGQIQTFSKELIALQPDVILSRSTAATAAILHETRTIPIVFVVVSDPVGDGFVSSMARPGGNATGFTNVEASLGGKWIELLKEIVPGISRVAIIFNPKTAPGGGAYYLRLIKDAAASSALNVVPAPINDDNEIESAIETFTRQSGGGLIVGPDLTTTNHRATIIAAAARHRLPAVYPFRHEVSEGGLISYGIDIKDLHRRAAGYVDRILRGAKPTDLPVQGPTKFELAINLKTAKTLGLTMPPTLLTSADEVIE